MTANELQNLVRSLSNSCWVRYWLHYSYPSRSPWLMAIECRNESGASPELPELIELGFTYQPTGSPRLRFACN